MRPQLNDAAEALQGDNEYRRKFVSMGHSDATYREAHAGFSAGAKGVTHIFNAMRGVHHREPGIAGFGLTNPDVYVEVIADPFHLHPKTIELIFSAKKPEKIIIVSDSVKAAKMDTPERGVTDSTGKLLGGSMTITESARYLIGLGFSKDIVERCISLNPEEYLAVGAPGDATKKPWDLAPGPLGLQKATTSNPCVRGEVASGNIFS